MRMLSIRVVKICACWAYAKSKKYAKRWLSLRIATYLIEYLGEFEFIFKTVLGYVSGDQVGSFEAKKTKSKISCLGTFNKLKPWKCKKHFLNLFSPIQDQIVSPFLFLKHETQERINEIKRCSAIKKFYLPFYFALRTYSDAIFQTLHRVIYFKEKNWYLQIRN
jgi:hypothetical protein